MVNREMIHHFDDRKNNPVPRTAPCFSGIPGKNDPHIHIPAGFPGPGWGKLCGEKIFDLMAFGGLLARCISPLFWQTWQYPGLFSTGTEKEDFAGFSGIGRHT